MSLLVGTIVVQSILFVKDKALGFSFYVTWLLISKSRVFRRNPSCLDCRGIFSDARYHDTLHGVTLLESLCGCLARHEHFIVYTQRTKKGIISWASRFTRTFDFAVRFLLTCCRFSFNHQKTRSHFHNGSIMIFLLSYTAVSSWSLVNRYPWLQLKKVKASTRPVTSLLRVLGFLIS